VSDGACSDFNDKSGEFWDKTLLHKSHECDYICFNVKEACLLVTNIAWHINFHIALPVPF
jgi:hypothetical protein